MRVLVIGSGGREHAIGWALSRSPSVESVASAPGNPGLASLGTTHAIPLGDLDGLLALATRERFDLVVVGPEAPLVAGLADRLRAAGVPCFGPAAEAARLEGSKAFAKERMAAAGVPTAEFTIVEDLDAGLAAARRFGWPAVLKVDGLAAGKGVVIARDESEARAFLARVFEQRSFGEAGARLVVERHLEGEELSFFAVTDGDRVVPLPAARDYKRLASGDRGPNTGGMGAFAPAPTPAGEEEEILAQIVRPVLRSLAREGTPYVGALFCGLMRTRAGLRVLEFNCRFGDPETQALLPLLDGDLGSFLHGAAIGRLPAPPRARPGACVAVVLAAPGYPDAPRVGGRIDGVAQAEAEEGVFVFHAGTSRRDGGLAAAGGRVLAVSALGGDRSEARERAYRGMRAISLEGGSWRDDVAAEGAAIARR